MQLISDKTLQDIEKSLGLKFLDEEKRNSMMTDMIELICSRAGIRIMKAFNEKETKEFNLIPEDALEEMENYILEKNPQAREIFEEEAQRAKNEVLDAKIGS